MKKIAKKVVIAVFAYGEPARIAPNQRLAMIAKECSGKYQNYLIVTQDDIDIGAGFNVINVKNKPRRPATTLMVARKAVAEAQIQGVTTIYIVAGRPHLWRCIRDVKAVILGSGLHIEICIAPRIKNTNYWSWFNKKSKQFRTQSPLKGFWYEPLFRAIPFWLYRRVAG